MPTPPPSYTPPTAPWFRGGGFAAGGRFGGGGGYGPMRGGGRGGGRGARGLGAPGFHPYRRPHSFPLPGRGGFGNKSLVLGAPKSPAGAAAAAATVGANGAGSCPPAAGAAGGSGRAKSPTPSSAFQHRALVRDPTTGIMHPPTKNKVWVNPALAAAASGGGAGAGRGAGSG